MLDIRIDQVFLAHLLVVGEGGFPGGTDFLIAETLHDLFAQLVGACQFLEAVGLLEELPLRGPLVGENQIGEVEFGGYLEMSQGDSTAGYIFEGRILADAGDAAGCEADIGEAGSVDIIVRVAAGQQEMGGSTSKQPMRPVISVTSALKEVCMVSFL